MNTAFPLVLGNTRLTLATPGAFSIAPATRDIAATSPGECTSLATRSGPLKPGPKP
jgi:hypothetical protein